METQSNFVITYLDAKCCFLMEILKSCAAIMVIVRETSFIPSFLYGAVCIAVGKTIYTRISAAESRSFNNCR